MYELGIYLWVCVCQLNDANGKAKEALEQTRKNLEKTAEELRKAHPDVEKQATALREKLQTAVQNAVKVTTSQHSTLQQGVLYHPGLRS